MRFQKDVLLKNYTTFKIGGKAKYFFTAKTKSDLVKAIRAAKKHKLPFFILGGGSNILFSDKGYQGLVIRIQNSKIELPQEAKVKMKTKFSSPFKIYCEAGLSLSKLVFKSSEIGASGLEWAAGIPGTVGGAVYGNAGAFNRSMKDAVKEVEAFDVKKNMLRKLKNKDCQFAYRSSVFKKNPNLIILACSLGLKTGDKQKTKQAMQEHLDYRDKRHPKEPSAGSIFKNPQGTSARELIDKCGLKGKRMGGAGISEVHSNFIVNLNGASSQDVLKLINLIKKEINKKFKIKLKEEIVIL